MNSANVIGPSARMRSLMRAVISLGGDGSSAVMPIHDVIGHPRREDDPRRSATATVPAFNTLWDHARMSIRPAATIVVARPAEATGGGIGEPNGVEVLILRRSARSRF